MALESARGMLSRNIDGLTLEQALGQYLLYRSLLQRQEPARRLVLALPADAYGTILSTELGRAVREDYALFILVFDADQEVIRQWLP